MFVVLFFLSFPIVFLFFDLCLGLVLLCFLKANRGREGTRGVGSKDFNEIERPCPLHENHAHCQFVYNGAGRLLITILH